MHWLKDIVRGLAKSSTVIRILAVMPRNHDGHDLLKIAQKAQWNLEFAPDYASALQLVKDEHFHAILCDRDLSTSWREAIVSLALLTPGSAIILTSSINDDYLWQEVIRLGGFDVLTKPFHEERVLRSVQFACSSRHRPAN